MRELIIQILLDNAPWATPDEKHRNHPGMPAWVVPNGLLIRHPDGGLIFLPITELLQMRQDHETVRAAAAAM